MISKRTARRPVRYAVVGLGAIAQSSVLPGFANARNSELVALVSDDPGKLRKLGRKYGVEMLFDYQHYEQALTLVDAVYICLPNHLHRDYAVRAAQHGVNVLCEKPMAPTSAECEDMIRASADHGVALMIAYRLHFEQANLAAIEAVTSGRIGEPRYFTSEFSYQVKPGNVRLEPVPGAGPVWDIGVYCVNAARYLFRAEPTEVFAYRVGGRDERSRAVEEGAGAMLRFPDDRLAQFTVSYAAAGVDAYRIVGSTGDLYLEHAYDYGEEPTLCLNLGGKLKERSFRRHDQFGAEIAYFSRCVAEGADPEPSGHEGLADVRVIEALFRATAENRPVAIDSIDPGPRPDRRQEITMKPRRQPRMVHAEEASEEE